MKKNILKAVAMPAKLYGAPMALAGANVGIQLPLALFVQTFSDLNPIYFVFSLLSLQFLFILLGLKEPHLSKLLEINGKSKRILIDKYATDNATVLFKDHSFMCFFDLSDALNIRENSYAFMKYISEYKLNLRFINVMDIPYLILSGKQNRRLNISEIIQNTLTFFPNAQLLTKSSRVTPVDVIKSILNPISSASAVVASNLSERSLLINERKLLKKGVIQFEQNGQKLYASVFSLFKLNNVVDFDIIASFKQTYMVSSWVFPMSNKKAFFLFEQQRRMSRLTAPLSEKKFIEAMEQLEKGEIFCQYGVNVYLTASSVQQLEAKEKELLNTAKQYGLFFIKETWHLPFAFYIGLPQYEATRRFTLPLSCLNI